MELLNTYDIYGDFIKENYFVQVFNSIPSKLNLNLPVKANKENMEAVLNEINLEVFQLEIIYKYWEASSKIEAVESDDFPFQYFYKSKEHQLCLWISLQNQELYFEFLYHHTDTAVEQWILETLRKVRNKFGKEKSPTFKVLTKQVGFSTEDININPFEVDIKKLYNDDFQSINQTIDETLEADNSSGLILLHGTPGTGKTSYIKNLLSKHKERTFIFIPNDFVNELLQPGFISFMINHKNSILVIEDAEKVITSREQNENSVVSTILQLTDGLFSDYLNIKIICTFNTSIDKVDKALLRKGRMIAFYEFKTLSVEKTNILLEERGQEARNEEMTVAEIFNTEKRGYAETQSKNGIGF